MPKLGPSPGVHPPGRRLELVIVESILIGFSLFIVGLRLITRFLIVKSPGWDDYAVILATITAIAETSMTMSAIRYGAGLHHQSPFDITSTLKLFYFARILYALTVTSIKISILLLYLRLFPGPRIRLWIKTVIMLVYTGFIVLTLLWIFMCQPVSHAWVPSSPRECIDRKRLFQANATFGLVVNIVIIALPTPIIWKLHMSLRKRLVVLGIFAIGLVPCGSLVARLILPLTAPKFDSDPTWWIVETEEWVLAEYTTGLICASLIHLKPLVVRFLPYLCRARRGISASKLLTHNTPPHIREAFSRMDDRKYGYGSPIWASKRTRQTTFLDGPHDCRSEFIMSPTPTTSEPPDSPTTPKRVYAWAPRVCRQQDAPLLRHASPV